MSIGEMVCACTIAGSDSGGGAGIQADLKTFSALGVWGCTVVTAITAQNTREVRGSWILSPESVRMQMEAVFDDFSIGAVKTGMLGNDTVIRTVVDSLPEEIPLVVDPVMVSTSGYGLLESGTDIFEDLISRANLITPNIPEALALTGMRSITSVQEMILAGRRLQDLGANAVLVKGGHLPGERAVDVFVDKEGELILEGERYPYQVHGSGCCLSAAIAAYIAKNTDVREACRNAKTFMDGAIRFAAVSRSGLRIIQPMKALKFGDVKTERE